MTRNLLPPALLVCSLTVVAVAQVRLDDVVRNLRNPDPKARMSSLEILREARHVEAMTPIAPLVNDPVDAIQLAAVDTELSFFLVEPVSARKRVALIVEVRNSGRAESAFEAGPLAVWPHAVPAELATNLLKAVDDENPKVRIEALYTFGSIVRPPVSGAHADQLVRALDHYDPAIRHGAARVAGRLQVKAAGDALIKAVNDSQEPVRFAAMRALGEIGEAAAINALVQQLEYYRKGEGAWSALEGLARIGHGSSVPIFKSRLSDRDQFVRRSAAEGLGRAGATSEIPALETLFTSDSSDAVRAAAGFALQKLGRDAVPQLAAMLGSERLAPQVAGHFIELGSGVANGLAVHLKDPNASVRANAAQVLGAIGDSTHVTMIEPLLHEKDRDVVRAAQRAIERIKMRLR